MRLLGVLHLRTATIAMPLALALASSSVAFAVGKSPTSSSAAEQFAVIGPDRKTYVCQAQGDKTAMPGLGQGIKWKSLVQINRAKIRNYKGPAKKKAALKKRLSALLESVKLSCSNALSERRCKVQVSDLSAIVPEHGSVQIELGATSTCGRALSFAVSEPPRHGAFSLSGQTVVYSTNHDPENDAFTYVATDSKGRSASAKVTLTVGARLAEFAGDPDSLDPYRSHITKSEARHLLKKVALGGSPELIAKSQQMTLEEFVDLLLTEPSPAEEAQLQASIEAVSAPLRTTIYLSQDIDNNPATGTDKGRETLYSKTGANRTMTSVRVGMLHELLNGAPLRNNMILFWHDHFGVGDGFAAQPEAYEENFALLRTNALGSFDKMLHYIVRGNDVLSAAWLTNYNNTYQSPNQNFGRELLQLYTLGTVDPITHAPNYSEEDIAAATHAVAGFNNLTFTSYPIALNLDMNFPAVYPGAPGAPSQFTFNRIQWYSKWEAKYWMKDPTRPDDIEIFKGAPWAEKSALNVDTFPLVLLYSHPGSARYIGAKLFTVLAHPEPNEAIVSALARLLVDNQYEVRPALKKILMSSAMFSRSDANSHGARRTCVASTMETVLSFLHMLKFRDDDAAFAALLRDDASFAGTLYASLNAEQEQQPYATKTVFGWRGCGVNRNGMTNHGEVWLQSVLSRRRLFVEIMNLLNQTMDRSGLAWTRFLPTEGATPLETVNYFADLLDIELTDAERNEMAGYLDTSVIAPSTLIGKDPSAWQKVTGVWNPRDPGLVAHKLSGLFILLFNHRDFQMR